MSASEVTEALGRYENLLRRLGVPVVANLRPGISPADVRKLEAQYGLELPDEARAVWEWHNGVEEARGSYTNDARRMLTPYRAFGDLAWSLEFTHQFTTITAETNPTSEYASRVFVSLLIDNVGFFINVTPGEPVLTYMNDPMSWMMSDYPSMPIAERVDWWTWALETGVWSIDENATWQVDMARYPDGDNGNVL